MENWTSLENFIFIENEPIAMFNVVDSNYNDVQNADERARLAAAAPDLLEACKAAQIIFEEKGLPAETSGVKIINQALKKALTPTMQ